MARSLYLTYNSRILQVKYRDSAHPRWCVQEPEPEPAEGGSGPHGGPQMQPWLAASKRVRFARNNPSTRPAMAKIGAPGVQALEFWGSVQGCSLRVVALMVRV